MRDRREFISSVKSYFEETLLKRYGRRDTKMQPCIIELIRMFVYRVNEFNRTVCGCSRPTLYYVLLRSSIGFTWAAVSMQLHRAYVCLCSLMKQYLLHLHSYFTVLIPLLMTIDSIFSACFPSSLLISIQSRLKGDYGILWQIFLFRCYCCIIKCKIIKLL